MRQHPSWHCSSSLFDCSLQNPPFPTQTDLGEVVHVPSRLFTQVPELQNSVDSQKAFVLLKGSPAGLLEVIVAGFIEVISHSDSEFTFWHQAFVFVFSQQKVPALTIPIKKIPKTNSNNTFLPIIFYAPYPPGNTMLLEANWNLFPVSKSVSM